MKIKSIKDPHIIYARELSAAKGRLKRDKFLLYGEQQLIWGLESNVDIEIVFIHDRVKENLLLSKLEKNKIPYFFVSEGILKKIIDTTYVIPFIAVAKNPIKKKLCEEDEFVIILDNLVDYGNIGTIIRSALAFGIKDVISTRQNTDFFYKKIIDASRGKIFETNIKKFNSDDETIKYLKEHGYQIITTSPHAKQIQSLTNLSNKPIALILGNETIGCSEAFINHADILIKIPMSSMIESLNVAVAAGISMYELKIKLVIGMLIAKIYKTIGRQFGITSQLIRQAFNVELSKVTSYSSMQIILLMILKCDEFMSIDQVVKYTGEHNEGLDLFLKPLIDNGYIGNTVQNRVLGLTLTRLGEELIAKLWPIVEKAEEKILENFSESEKAQLIEYISRVQDNCHKIIGL